MPTKFDFTGRVAVVTGGASGFGRAICERLLKDGASVALWDRERRRRRKGGEGNGRQRRRALPSTSPTTPRSRSARDATISKFGKVDILVNSAGIAGPNATLWEYPLDDWATVQKRQPRRHVLLLQGAGPGHDRAELRPHRQHRLDRRQGRQSQRVRLRRVEGGGHRPHQVARQGARHLQHRRQRHRPGRRDDSDPRRGDGGVHATTCCPRSRAAAPCWSRKSPT